MPKLERVVTVIVYVIVIGFAGMMLYTMRDVFLPSSDPLILEMHRRLDGIPKSEIPRSADNALRSILEGRLSFAMSSCEPPLAERLQTLLQEDFSAAWHEMEKMLRNGPMRIGPGELIWSDERSPGMFCELMEFKAVTHVQHRVKTGEVSQQEAERMVECLAAATR
jgi:hypothetical protein